MSRIVRLLITASVLIALAGGWALLFNAIRPGGIPLVRSRAAQEEVDDDTNLLTLARAKSLYEQGAVFVDSRSPAEYESGHIRGSRHLYYMHAEEEWETVMADVPFEMPIVSYCSGEGCNSSFLVADQLQNVGFEKVYIFDGGWPEWSAAGYPLDGQAAAPPQLYDLK